MNNEDFEDTYYLDYSDGCVKLYDDADAFIYQSTLNEEDYFSALADADIEVFEDNKTENIPLSKITDFIDIALDGDDNAKRMFTKSMLYFRESSTSKLSESKFNDCIRAVEKFKKQLISKAQKSGVYENFGQKEIRQLKNMFGSDYSTDGQKCMNLISSFDNWCQNYTGINESVEKLSESSMKKFEVELLGDFKENSDYYTEEYFESSFTFNIKPVSIVSSIDTYDGEINITMNNGDKIEYKYNIDPSGRYSNKDSYEFTINGKSFPADGEEGFIYEIIHGYNEYLKINNN